MVNNEEQRGFWPPRRLPKRRFTKIQEVLFIRKTNVLLGHVGALKRRPMCAQLQQVRSSTLNYSEIPRRNNGSNG
jgi:hypothetical protein